MLTSHASKKKKATATKFHKLLSVVKIDKKYWSRNRNKTWFTKLLEKRKDENFQESLQRGLSHIS